jgi:hypothetical protein
VRASRQKGKLKEKSLREGAADVMDFVGANMCRENVDGAAAAFLSSEGAEPELVMRR